MVLINKKEKIFFLISMHQIGIQHKLLQSYLSEYVRHQN